MRYNFTEKLKRIIVRRRQNINMYYKLQSVYHKKIRIDFAEDPFNSYLIDGASYPLYKSNYRYKHLRVHSPIKVKNNDNNE